MTNRLFSNIKLIKEFLTLQLLGLPFIISCFITHGKNLKNFIIQNKCKILNTYSIFIRLCAQYSTYKIGYNSLYGKNNSMLINKKLPVSKEFLKL